MAEALYLCTKSDSNHFQTVNGIVAVLINADDGGSNTVIAAAAQAAAASFTGTEVDSSFRTGYFDTITKVSDLSSGPLKDAGDAYVFIEGHAPKKVEGA
jgi:hypothetical protein